LLTVSLTLAPAASFVPGFAFWEITRPSLTLAENALVTFPTEQCARSSYGQLDVRVTVFEVIGMPGIAGVLSESAEVPVAVAE
jgi:hypothetical protein